MSRLAQDGVRSRRPKDRFFRGLLRVNTTCQGFGLGQIDPLPAAARPRGASPGPVSVNEGDFLVLHRRFPAFYPGGLMRTVFLLPLAAVMAVVVGCGSQGRERAALSTPRRDLTLATAAREVDVASPVELRQIRTRNQTLRASHRSSRRSSLIEPISVPTALPAASLLATPAAHPGAQPVSTPAEPVNDRELLPGKTVTVIPVSSGPSTAPEWTDERSESRGGTMVTGRGGRCGRGGRGPGIGIAAAPRPDFR